MLYPGLVRRCSQIAKGIRRPLYRCWGTQYLYQLTWYGTYTRFIHGLTYQQPAPNLEFASRTFDSLRRKNLERQSDVAIAAFFALERSLQRCPKDVAALHLAALISERLGLMVRAATFARRSSSLLEAAYERSEDAATARQYAITQSTLGRILLAEGDYTDAISSFETVLNLTDLEPDISDPQAESVRLRIQSHLGIGLASLLAGDAETAVSSLESGLEEAPAAMQTMRMQLTVLLAQTMWVLGTDDTREAAKSILLEKCVILCRLPFAAHTTNCGSIESDPKNLAATVVLGAISTLLNDNVLLEATLSEIVSLSPQERRQLDRLRQVDALLLRHHLMQVYTSFLIAFVVLFGDLLICTLAAIAVLSGINHRCIAHRTTGS